jgi:(1->4)-alpha-D-glucan 1-alpha-D-glucosylmutase
LRDALMEVVANFPVYRTYVSPAGTSDKDADYISRAIALAKWRNPAADTSVFDFVREVLLTRIAEGQNVNYRKTVTAFAMKFQQFSSPVMAKGLEDTAFYRYNRLVSVNDVGGDLHQFGITTPDFHKANAERLHDWPHTMLATSTHDSKRSEDVRARIDALSEMPGLWRLRVRDWRRLNRVYRSTVNGKPAPSPNDEYLLYQTLVGAWPLVAMTEDSEWQAFRERIENYMLKAMREAKQNTSWINRNAEYETAVSAFVKALLSPGGQNRFLDDFVPFQSRIARIGLWNSLSQTVLKLTCPGVPDIYQGNDLWDFSLVDPDNRRPVDYLRRQRVFESVRRLSVEPDKASAAEMLKSPEDGRLKLYTIWKTLCLRKEYPELFQAGEYVRLEVHGNEANHVVAFIRKHEKTSALIVLPRLVAGLLKESDRPPIGAETWTDTRILSRCACPARFRNVYTGEALDLQTFDGKAAIQLRDALADFPVGVFLQR